MRVRNRLREKLEEEHMTELSKDKQSRWEDSRTKHESGETLLTLLKLLLHTGG